MKEYIINIQYTYDITIYIFVHMTFQHIFRFWYRYRWFWRGRGFVMCFILCFKDGWGSFLQWRITGNVGQYMFYDYRWCVVFCVLLYIYMYVCKIGVSDSYFCSCNVCTTKRLSMLFVYIFFYFFKVACDWCYTDTSQDSFTNCHILKLCTYIYVFLCLGTEVLWSWMYIGEVVFSFANELTFSLPRNACMGRNPHKFDCIFESW